MPSTLLQFMEKGINMRNFFRFESLYARLAMFLLAVTVYFIPSHGELNGFGFPIAFFTFPSGNIRNCLLYTSPSPRDCS